jgi:hypothetical protein
MYMYKTRTIRISKLKHTSPKVALKCCNSSMFFALCRSYSHSPSSSEALSGSESAFDFLGLGVD